jgi:hypothetical protein
MPINTPINQHDNRDIVRKPDKLLEDRQSSPYDCNTLYVESSSFRVWLMMHSVRSPSPRHKNDDIHTMLSVTVVKRKFNPNSFGTKPGCWGTRPFRYCRWWSPTPRPPIRHLPLHLDSISDLKPVTDLGPTRGVAKKKDGVGFPVCLRGGVCPGWKLAQTVPYSVELLRPVVCHLRLGGSDGRVTTDR